MVFLGDIGKVIGGIVEGIGKAIGEIVEGIYKVVSDILESVVKAITDLVDSIVSFIEEHFGLIIGIIGVVLAVGGVYYWLVINVPAFQAFVFQSPTLTKLYLYTAYAKNLISYVINTARLRIVNLINPVLTKIAPYITRITRPIRTALSFVREGLQVIRESILGRIYEKLSGVAWWLYRFRIIADIYTTIKDKKIVKAIWQVLKVVDRRITDEIEKQVRAIYSDINQVRAELLDLIDGLIRDIRIIDSKASYIEDTFRKLYESFGVSVFGDVAREVNRFRAGLLRTVEEHLRRADSWVMKEFQKLTSPFTSMFQLFYTTEEWLRREERLVRAFMLNPYRRTGFLGYTRVGIISIPVHREILRALGGR